MLKGKALDNSGIIRPGGHAPGMKTYLKLKIFRQCNQIFDTIQRLKR